MSKFPQISINNSMWDSTCGESNRSTLYTAKNEEQLRDPNDSMMLLHADRKFSSELVYYPNKSQIERELCEFVKGLNPEMEGEANDCLNYLKSLIGGLVEENDNMNYALEASEGILKEGANHFINREKILQRRLLEIEEDKVKYDEAIKKHGVYIAELESMVNQLIREYLHVLINKEAMMNELKLARAGMSTAKEEAIIKEIRGEKPDLDLLSENERLKLELLKMKEEKERLEMDKKSLEMVVMVNKIMGEKKNDPEYASMSEIKDTGSSHSEGQQSRMLFVEKLREQELRIKELEAENNELKADNIRLDKTLKDLQKDKKTKEDILNENINELTLTLNEIQNHIDLSSIMYKSMTTSILSKPEFQQLPETPKKSVESLKNIVERLHHENVYITNIYNKSLTLLSALKGQVCDKELLNKKKVKAKCFVCEEEGYEKRLQMFQVALVEAGKDLKKACEKNEELREELDLVKNKFVDYKEDQEKFECEVKRCLENYKEHDNEVSEKLMEVTESEDPAVFDLAQLYVNTKRDVFEVINMFENKEDVF